MRDCKRVRHDLHGVRFRVREAGRQWREDEDGMSFDPAAEGWKVPEEWSGFVGEIGPLWVRRGERGLRVGFEAEARHANVRGVVHGGMLMTLADQMMGQLTWYVAGGRPCATASLSNDFLSPARIGEWIEGEAAIVHQGKSLIFVRGDLKVGDRPVLSATGIWKILGT